MKVKTLFRRRFLAVCVVLSALGAACASDIEPLDKTGQVFSPAPCASPTSVTGASFEGANVPDTMVIEDVELDGSLTQADGFIPMTPNEVLNYYKTADGIDILEIDDEGFEAEIVITDGKTRTFVKVRTICLGGSAIRVVGAPESEGEKLPEVGPGSQSPDELNI